MRILIVEDEFKIADVIASRLRNEQYIVDVYVDGEEGLDNALTNIYDLVVLDVMLPGIEGFKILQEIRRQINRIWCRWSKINIKTTTLLCKTTNESIEVVCKEFMLLEYFMKNEKRVIPKEQLYEKICGVDSEAESNNLEAYLSFIRKKIKIIASSVQIKAVRGLGYKLEC